MFRSPQPATWGGARRPRNPEPTCCGRTRGTPSSSVRGRGRRRRAGGEGVRAGAVTRSPAAPRVEPARLEDVLEPCAYAPTYVVKDFPIARYQGLQFVSAPRTPGCPPGCPAPQAVLPGLPPAPPSALSPHPGIPALRLPQRPHAPHAHGDGKQVLLPRVPALPGEVGASGRAGAWEGGCRRGGGCGRGEGAPREPLTLCARPGSDSTST